MSFRLLVSLPHFIGDRVNDGNGKRAGQHMRVQGRGACHVAVIMVLMGRELSVVIEEAVVENRGTEYPEASNNGRESSAQLSAAA